MPTMMLVDAIVLQELRRLLYLLDDTVLLHLTLVLVIWFVTVTLARCVRACVRWYCIQPQTWLTRFIMRFSNNLYVEGQRSAFTDLSLTKPSLPRNHTHPEMAADRNTASLFATRYAMSIGRIPFFAKMSAPDVRRGAQGRKVWTHAKDLHVDMRDDDYDEKRHLLVFVDGDYSEDMPKVLSQVRGPVLIYTFQPEAAARSTNGYAYTFESDGKVEYRVTGGGRYNHFVWNYAQDAVVFRTTTCGLISGAVSFLIDRRSTMTDHQLVLFTPTRQWGWWSAWSTLALLDCVLHPLQVVEKNFIRMLVQKADGMYVSTARVGTYACATIKAESDDALAAMARVSTIDLTIPSAQRFVDGDVAAACVLKEYHCMKTPRILTCVVPLIAAVRTYQYEPDEYVPAKPIVVAFMHPIVNGAFCPGNDIATERRAIKTRIVDVIDKTEMTPVVARYMTEFLELFIPVPHDYDPTTDEEVYERQNRPTQRRLLDQACIREPKRRIQSFIKKEAYGKVGDPRIISTIDSRDKLEYSRFMYVLAAFLKKTAWYAFGNTPRAIAQRVADICTKARVDVSKTDFSKMDGHVCPAAREFEAAVCMRLFRPEHHADLLEFMRSQYGLKAYGRHGTKYTTGTARASGSPETSVFNTLINVFIAFMALRMGGLTDLEAYEALGVYGGDDGLTADVSEENYNKAAALLGQKLTIEPVRRGAPGVMFLARCYSPDVWYGDINSCCDIKRQLSKFHVTTALPSNVTANEKFTEKLRGFQYSDANTPVFVDLLAMAARLGVLLVRNDKTLQIANWLADTSVDEHYHNVAAPWMRDLFREQLPTFDEKLFLTHIVKCNSENFLRFPECATMPEPEITVPVVVDGLARRPPATLAIRRPPLKNRNWLRNVSFAAKAVAVTSASASLSAVQALPISKIIPVATVIAEVGSLRSISDLVFSSICWWVESRVTRVDWITVVTGVMFCCLIQMMRNAWKQEAPWSTRVSCILLTWIAIGARLAPHIEQDYVVNPVKHHEWRNLDSVQRDLMVTGGRTGMPKSQSNTVFDRSLTPTGDLDQHSGTNTASTLSSLFPSSSSLSYLNFSYFPLHSDTTCTTTQTCSMNTASHVARDTASTIANVVRDVRTGAGSITRDVRKGIRNGMSLREQLRPKTSQSARRSAPRANAGKFPKPRRYRGLAKQGDVNSDRNVDDLNSRPQREFIGHIDGSTTFASNAIGISPLNPQMFPVLSNKAANYEMYRFKRLRYILKSTSGSVSSTAALGYVGLGVTYDPSDPLLTSEADMLNYDGGKSFKSWVIDTKGEMTVEYDLNSGPLNWRYVNHDSNATFSELGTMYTFTFGNPSGDGVAMLYVEYEIEFKKLRTANLVSQTQTITISTTTNSNNYSFTPDSAADSYVRTDTGQKIISLPTNDNISFLALGYYHVSLITVESGTVAAGGGAVIAVGGCAIIYPTGIATSGSTYLNVTNVVVAAGGNGCGFADFWVNVTDLSSSPTIAASSPMWSSISNSSGKVTVTATRQNSLPGFAVPIAPTLSAKDIASYVDAQIRHLIPRYSKRCLDVDEENGAIVVMPPTYPPPSVSSVKVGSNSRK